MKNKLIKISIGAIGFSSIGLGATVILASCSTSNANANFVSQKQLKNVYNCLQNNINNQQSISLEILNSSNNIINLKKQIANILNISNEKDIQSILFSNNNDFYNVSIKFSSSINKTFCENSGYFIINKSEDNSISITTEHPIKYNNQLKKPNVVVNNLDLWITINNWIEGKSFLDDLNKNSKQLVDILNDKNGPIELNNDTKVVSVEFKNFDTDTNKIIVSIKFNNSINYTTNSKNFVVSSNDKKELVNKDGCYFSFNAGLEFDTDQLDKIESLVKNRLSSANDINAANNQLNQIKTIICKDNLRISEDLIKDITLQESKSLSNTYELKVVFNRQIRVFNNSGDIVSEKGNYKNYKFPKNVTSNSNGESTGCNSFILERLKIGSSSSM